MPKKIQLSDDELRLIMPLLRTPMRRAYLPHLQAAMDEFAISANTKRMAAFLPQLAHESAQLRYFEEIASGAAYEGRRDLGNTERGDGKRYKGRGPIQLTGRANYRKYGDLLGLPLEDEPHIAASLEVGFRIAGLYWKLNGLNALADGLTLTNEQRDYNVTKLITKRINGGYNGLQDRWQYFERARDVLSKREAPQISGERGADIIVTTAAPAQPAEVVPPVVPTPAATPAPAEPSALDELPSVSGTMAASVGKKALGRAAWFSAKLFAALEAGSYFQLSIYALVIVVIAVVVWHYRAAIKSNWRKLLKKVKFGE